MPLVDQHQVVLLEAIHRDGLDPALVLQLVYIDHEHLFARGQKAAALFEQRRRDGRARKLFQMLPTHLLVGRQHNDPVEGQAAVSLPCAAKIVQKLQNMDVYQQRFSAAGGAHERQPVQPLRRIGRKRDPATRLTRFLLHPHVQIAAEVLGVRKIPVQIALCEQQRQILKILPADPAALFADPMRMAADVLIIKPQLFRRDGPASAAQPEQIFTEIRAPGLSFPFQFGAVQFSPQFVQRIHAKLVQEIAKQDQLLVERGPRCALLCHVHSSSNIRFRNSNSVISTVQRSPLRRSASS